MPTVYGLISIGGISIRAHLSALVGFVSLMLLLAAAYLPVVLPREQSATLWSVGFLTTLAFFVSLVLHELGHAAGARALGVHVDTITLHMFGGVSDIRRDDQRPIDEFLIEISGPAVSLLLAALTAFAHSIIASPSQPLSVFLEAVLILNIWLGLFNLLPTLPLDGGRALRGLIWQFTGDFRRSTKLASRVGQGLGALLFLVGLSLVVISMEPSKSPLGPLGGIEPRNLGFAAIVVAWFVNRGARAAYRQAMWQGRFVGVTVADLMNQSPPTVSAWTRLDEVVADHFVGSGERAVAVVREPNFLMGIVAYADVRKVDRAQWPNRAAGEVMTPLADLITVTPSDRAEAAIQQLAERHLNQLPVVDEGKLVGMVARANIIRFLELDPGR